jgi:hypothetical protein
MRKDELKRILKKNEGTQQKSLPVKYNRKADMIIIGGSFPEGSLYVSVEDTGMLIRINRDEMIIGYAIENAKCFIQKNPNLLMSIELVPLVYPIRAKIAHHILKFIKTFSDMIKADTVNSYIRQYA